MADLPIEREEVEPKAVESEGVAVESTMKAELPKAASQSEKVLKSPSPIQVTQGNVELVMVKLLEECRDLLKQLVHLANFSPD